LEPAIEDPPAARLWEPFVPADGHCDVSSRGFPPACDSTRHFAGCPVADGAPAGSRRDIAGLAALRCGGRSESESHSERSKPRIPEVRDATARPSRLPSDIAGQAAWRGRPDANPRETRKLSPARQEKSQTLGYNLDVTHIFVLPHRSECFEGQGEVFYAPPREILNTRRHEPSNRYRSPRPLPFPSQHTLTARHVLKSLLERRNFCLLLLSK
jgi:hypothetical protein